MHENDHIEIHSAFNSNLSTLGFLEIIKKVLLERSNFIDNEDYEQKENSIMFPIIKTDTQA